MVAMLASYVIWENNRQIQVRIVGILELYARCGYMEKSGDEMDLGASARPPARDPVGE